MVSAAQVSSRTTHAGGVVYRRVEGEVLYAVVRSNDPVPVWVWPTGHLEPGETAVQAALREVCEETGIAARVVAELPERSFDRGGERSTVAYFLLEYASPVVTREVRTVAWATYRDACALLAHAESVELLTGAQAVLVDALAKSGRTAAATKDWAAELLMKDYDALTRELEQNEARGETRLSIYLTIVTAVIGGVVALASSSVDRARDMAPTVGGFAMAALLALGVMLFLRMIKRNENTDGFRKDLQHARAIARGRLDPAGLLVEWRPFQAPRDRSKGSREAADNLDPRPMGGLADLVAVINSILTGGMVLVVMSGRFERVGSAMVAVLVAAVSFLLHVRYRERRERERKRKYAAKSRAD